MRTHAVIVSLLVLAACSSKTTPIAPARLVAAGDTQIFGSGPSGLSADGRHLLMDLKAASNVSFFNVHPDGWVDQLSSRALPAGRHEVRLPRTSLDRTGSGYEGGRTSMSRRQAESAFRSTVSRQRVLRREALLVVVWQRGVDPAPTFTSSRLLVDDQLPEWEIPEVMFEARQTAWAAYVIDKRP